ncbi:MAG TPA: hypothetical protein VL728_19655 [Cyclobacteriaceae bacterium]|jgi:hypothetical protein|nr:hypothetical protein [Cyclobacteriaceae bacterium]
MKSIYEILRRKYPENEYCLMEEVSDAAGYHRSRSADFIVVNLWPSRGLAINGIELKSFRNDWLSELKKPQKAENIFQYCDYFWLLTSDDNVAKIEEIPISWGWMTIKNEKVFVKKEAPKLEPRPVSRHFMCSMLKRAVDKTGFIHRDSIKDEIEKQNESTKISKEWELKRLGEENAQLTKIINDFKESSGIDLHSTRWNGYKPSKIGEAVKFIMNNDGLENFKKGLSNLEAQALRIHDNIRDGLKLFANTE